MKISRQNLQSFENCAIIYIENEKKKKEKLLDVKIHLNNIKQKNIIFFDIEYDRSSLVQMASLILRQEQPNIFVIEKSFNVYVKPNRPLSKFFVKYTNITNDFLCENGVGLPVARSLVDQIVFNVDKQDTLIVSHGVRGDLDILERNGFDISNFLCQYCTYSRAKELLHRDSRLTLKDVAAEGGYCIFNEHNAYADV